MLLGLVVVVLVEEEDARWQLQVAKYIACCSINKTDGHSVLALCDLSSAVKLADRFILSHPQT